MSQVVTQQQSTILDDLELLNLEDQQKVLDFIHFLTSKYQAKTIESLLDQPREVSFYEATKAFAGSLDWGSGDLATNKQYLEGLGE